MNLSTTLSIALAFFLVTNPIGNTPTILALVKDYDFDKQKKIVFREGIIALLVALFFQFFGEVFLGLLNIETYTVTICGGLLLFIVALNMIFTKAQTGDAAKLKKEPFIVPIATPILSGPGLMSIIMLFARKEQNPLMITTAIFIAWIGVMAVLMAGPYLQRTLGKRGMTALEQMMGMILAIMSMGMIVKGTAMYIKTI